MGSPGIRRRSPRAWDPRHVPEGDEAAVVHHGEHELGGPHVAAPGLALEGDGRRAAGYVVDHLDAEFGMDMVVSLASRPCRRDRLPEGVLHVEDLDQRSARRIANAAVEQSYEPGQEIVLGGDTPASVPSSSAPARSTSSRTATARSRRSPRSAPVMSSRDGAARRFPRSRRPPGGRADTALDPALGTSAGSLRATHRSRSRCADADARIRNAEADRPEAARH